MGVVDVVSGSLSSTEETAGSGSAVGLLRSSHQCCPLKLKITQHCTEVNGR